ncbi:hypothetical protein QBC47DRAFT_390158 [Echria macrotheca]|uniref:Uncharacterized protein n=1 Tax=Echria macrotheca TaxID=438768 RepID=A0AAJ0B5W1_9PEZI|nr:hypothetical protein QBC47DRAFT_390158 [Echria macrotheca]
MQNFERSLSTTSILVVPAATRMASLTSNPANATTGWNSSTSLSDDSNQVSRSEVFGIFLTLSFCLLSQPSGSLIYRPWPLYPWRLNPIACLAEAVLIVLVLMEVFLPGHDETVRPDHIYDERSEEWFRKIRTAWREIGDDIYALTAALLLARGNVGKNKVKTEEIAEMLTSSASFASRNGSLDRLGRRWGVATSESPEQPSLRSAEKSAVLRRAFGAGVFAHRELPVQAVTLLSITSVTVKLSTISLPLPLLATAFVMLGGWLSVQLLLIVFHSREHDSLDGVAVAAKFESISSMMDADQLPTRPRNYLFWIAVLFAVEIPFMAVVFTAVLPRAQNEDFHITLLYGIPEWIFKICSTVFLFLILWWLFVQRVMPLFRKRNHPDHVPSGRILKAAGILAPVSFSLFICGIYWWDISLRSESSSTGFDLSLSQVLVYSFATMPAFLYLPWAYAVGTPVYAVGRMASVAAQLVLLAVTGYAFGLWMYMYDGLGTSLPDWVKWLG